MPPDDPPIAPYDDVIDAYDLIILKEIGDWSLDDTGDLLLTKDGEPQHGDIAYSGLFRLVQMWRFSEPHVRRLFDAMGNTLALQRSLGDKLNEVGEARHARFSPETFLKPDPEFTNAFHDICDQQASASFGAGIYAGSLMLMLSAMLLRLRDDMAADSWSKVGPHYNGYSLGAIIEAGANGFRHADEWAKNPHPTPQQKRSQIVIASALSSRPPLDEGSPGGCVELLRLLSGDNFEALAAHVFRFAHNLAVTARGNPHDRG
jgi:hypothetical protein